MCARSRNPSSRVSWNLPVLGAVNRDRSSGWSVPSCARKGVRNELDHEPGRAREKRGMARRDVGFLGRSGGGGEKGGGGEDFCLVDTRGGGAAGRPGGGRGTKREEGGGGGRGGSRGGA